MMSLRSVAAGGRLRWSLLGLLCLAAAPVAARDTTAATPAPVLMRFPDSHDGRLVFVARGNLWTVAQEGGTATRLTRDAGQDLMPRFSPDGRWIAYTAGISHNQSVYVIPAGGGEPRRLTFGPGGNGFASASGTADNLVVTWTPDSRSVVFLSRQSSWNRKITRLYQVPVTGGLATALPLDHAGLMAYGPDGHSIAYTRLFRDFDSWKRYDGGQAQDIFTYDLQKQVLERITDWVGTDTSPMWFGRRIYFLSDRDAARRANLWVFDQDSRQFREVTHFTRNDIDFPALGTRAGGGTITFQQGGRLWAVDLPTEHLREIRVVVPDDGARTALRTVAVGQAIRDTDIDHEVNYALSPDGAEAAFCARGDLFAVPTGHGPTRNLTSTSTADEDHPAWSPDGRMLAYVTDAGGERQVALRPTGGGTERIITRFGSGYLYTPLWSPDGGRLAVADANHRLWLAGTDGSEPKLVAANAHRDIRDAAFSPDGHWLAFSTQQPNQQQAIHLYALDTGHDSIVSAPMESDSHPVFSPDGESLVFVSRRHALPVLSDDESDLAALKSDGIYVASLRRTPSAGSAGGGKAVAIDLDGLMRRVVPLPVVPAEIVAIEMRGSRVFYRTQPPQLVRGDLPGEVPALHVYDMRTRQDRVVVEGLDHAVVSADGRRVLYRQGTSWHVADAAPGHGHDSILALDGMQARVDPRQEWREMFEASWRLDRDLFFSAAMNGDDWRAVHDAYVRFLPLLGSRYDLTYLLGQLQGELGNSHMFVGDGDYGAAAPVRAARLLGVDYALDAASGRYRMAKIYAGDGSRPELRGPLAAPGVDAHAGDFLLAVDGHELAAPTDPYSLFLGDGPVRLTIASSATGARREVTVDPVDSEFALREQDRIERNRAMVDRLSGGRIGYVYLADFESRGTAQFIRQFSPQLDRQGLVIDIRGNAGGFTSQLVLERLRRVVVGRYLNREGGTETLPDHTFAGGLVTLMDHYSASDGDQFPYFFRLYGLGKVVGTRSWGGVRGIAGPWPLLDGGSITVPKDALYDTHGEWIIENHGVDPDMVVEDVPGEALSGHDIQLETAVRTLTDQLDHQPAVVPPPPLLPAYPATGDVPPSSR